jgi:hypothetical protein
LLSSNLLGAALGLLHLLIMPLWLAPRPPSGAGGQRRALGFRQSGFCAQRAQRLATSAGYLLRARQEYMLGVELVMALEAAQLYVSKALPPVAAVDLVVDVRFPVCAGHAAAAAAHFASSAGSSPDRFAQLPRHCCPFPPVRYQYQMRPGD